MAHVMTMPEVLAGTEEATISSWSVVEGDTVAVGDTIAEIETEKAVIDLPAPVAGTVGRLLVDSGQTVPVGTPLIVLLAADEDIDAVDVTSTIGTPAPATPATPEAAPAPAPASRPQPALTTAETDAAASSETAAHPSALPDETSAAPPSGSRHFASPLARRLARERGVDVTDITGSGPGGRVTRRDVERHGEPAPAAPVARTEATAFETVVPHTRMRRTIARRLTESKATVPHFYLRADCRMEALLELRRQINEVADERVSVNDLVVKAVARAFIRVPEANVRWSEEGTVHLSGIDVAVAVATGDGLLTPVVRAVGARSVTAVSADIKDLARRARSLSLRQHELEGGTMTVSNLGMHGVRDFGAIINPPHCGILAVGAAEQRAVVVDGSVEAATVMTVTLSADHRVL
ncbi:MAG: dihydrolipoamide acetyltransferase family protein, partial [Georgenia sp.]